MKGTIRPQDAKFLRSLSEYIETVDPKNEAISYMIVDLAERLEAFFRPMNESGPLTRQQERIINILANNGEEWTSSSEIARAVTGVDDVYSRQSVRVQIGKARRAGAKIESWKGSGYRLIQE